MKAGLMNISLIDYINQNIIYYYFKDNVLCSMAQMLPYKMQNNDKIEQVTYIYGACTHKDYRRQHLMDNLLNYSFELDKKK